MTFEYNHKITCNTTTSRWHIVDKEVQICKYFMYLLAPSVVIVVNAFFLNLLNSERNVQGSIATQIGLLGNLSLIKLIDKRKNEILCFLMIDLTL